MMVLAVDGALRTTAYCVGDTQLGPMELQRVVTQSYMRLPESLYRIFSVIHDVLERFGVEVMIVEDKHVGRNPRTGLDLARVDGVLMLAAHLMGIPVIAVSPTEVKLAAAGDGQASKYAVLKAMVAVYGEHEAIKARLRPEWIGRGGRNKCDDLSDALAIWHTFNKWGSWLIERGCD